MQADSGKEFIQSLPIKDEKNSQISQSSDQNDSQGGRCDKEGGEEEQDQAQDNSNLLALSLNRVRQNAAKQGQKRKMNPSKFNGVKSKVGQNVQVLNKTT